jgi:hypothetical protein
MGQFHYLRDLSSGELLRFADYNHNGRGRIASQPGY